MARPTPPDTLTVPTPFSVSTPSAEKRFGNRVTPPNSATNSLKVEPPAHRPSAAITSTGSVRWGDLYCYDAASGKIIWSRQLVKETEVRVPSWGFTGAPTVYENLLILNVGEAGMAVAQGNRQEIWKSGEESEAGYTTPLPVTRGDKTEIWLGSGKSYCSVFPLTGKQIWSIKWLTEYGVNAADPIPYGGQGFHRQRLRQRFAHSTRLPATADGEPNEIWKNRVPPDPTQRSRARDKHLYGVDGDANSRARLKCIEIETGKEVWAQPDFGTGGIIVATGKSSLCPRVES
jgi:outer membrane protein assembly factor BamB